MKHVHRRSFLRSAAGACLAIPFLESLAGCDPATAALARPRDLAAPKRLLVFWTPNGNVIEKWRPTGTPDAYELGPILQPLAPHQQDLLILDGIDALSAFEGPGDAHQKGTGQSLTGTELQEGDFPGDGGLSAGWADGISVDQTIADAVGGTTRFRSLELGVYVYGANVGSRISYRGPAQPIPPENDPAAAFTRIFGDLEVDPEKLARKLAERKSVLDAVVADYQRLLPRLGADDRVKLEAHLDAVRDIEMRLGSGGVVGGACQKPVLGDVPAPLEVPNIPATGKLQMDLIAMALACDLTRVGSLMWTNSASGKPFPWLSIPEGHHELAHRGDDDVDAQDKLFKINHWYAEQFAYLLAALKAIPEGDGTLLDNTLVLWTNEHAKGNDHNRRDMPYLVAGRCGGAVKPGRWLQFGGDVPHNNLLLGLMHAMDVPGDTFGNPAYCTGSIALG